MPKAFFFPSYLGGGFGHIGRCLALAQELQQRGWETAFALAGPHVERVRQAGHTVYVPRKPYRPRPTNKEGPAYTVFSDMNYQLVRDGFRSPRLIRATVKESRRFVEKFRPDVLIGDTWPLTSVVGRLVGLPVVQIIKSVVHPAAPRLIWWQEPPPGLVSPDPRPVFNPVLQKWGLPPIERAEDLLTGDLLLVPSIPELDPLPPDVDERTHYVGALTINDPRLLDPPSWLAELDSAYPLVYVTIGGGAGPVGSRRFFAAVLTALTDERVQAIISTSARFSPSDLPTPPPHIRVERWVPGLAVIARSDVVVFHGGYGTTMETVRCGVPSVIIPFHSEQESNARRLEHSGAAMVLLPGEGPLEPVPGRWKGGRFVTLIRRRGDLSPDRLRQAINTVLADGRYRANAQRLQRALSAYDGPARAADLVETILTKF